MDKRKLHCKIFSKGSTLSNSNKLRYEKFFKKFRNKKQAEDFIDTLKMKKINNSDFILSKLGKIYENFYKNYTLKQWGIHQKFK